MNINSIEIHYPQMEKRRSGYEITIPTAGPKIAPTNNIYKNQKKVKLIDIIVNGKPYESDDVILDDMYVTKNQVEEIRNSIYELKEEIESLNLDVNNDDDKMKILCYLYAKLQLQIKYYNPREIVGAYNNIIEEEKRRGLLDCRTIYGALINNYATCQGIWHTFEILCSFFDINSKKVDLEIPGVCGHAINMITFKDGKVLYLDLASEIGMTRDGRKNNIVKNDITFNFFLVGKAPFRIYTGFKDYPEEDFSYRGKLYQETIDNVRYILTTKKSKKTK